MDLAERVVGCALGAALGDALGAPFEFLRANNVPETLPAFELPWMDQPPGSTTDDTVMARNLMRSLAERGALDPDDLIDRHLEWLASEPPDVGSLTGRVLRRVARRRDAGLGIGDDPRGPGGSGLRLGDEARAEAEAVWEERGPEVSAGNGSVMYCAPLGLAYAHRPAELAGLAPLLSSLTHHDGRCRTSVLAVTPAVAALVRGEPSDPAAAAALRAVEDLEGGEELEFLVEAAGRSRPVDGPDQGFCLFTAGLAFQSLLAGGDAETELRRIVALGGDADTNAAVAGALLGARDGVDGLPPEWLGRLRDADRSAPRPRISCPSPPYGRARGQ